MKSWKDMEESEMHIAKWKKSVWKGYGCFDFNYLISVGFSGGASGKESAC